MESIGVDLHKNESQICVLTDEGEIIERRILTRRDRFAAELGKRPRARILIESATESEWVARCLEALGHEVIVADPNFAPMYATRTRKSKTDRRDARMLAEACRLGTYRPAHRTSEPQWQIREGLTARETMVRARSREISVIRSLLRRNGLRIREGSAERFLIRLAELQIPQHLADTFAPIVELLAQQNALIKAADKRLIEISKRDDVIRRLRTVPGVGPVTAVTFRSIVDQVERFERAHQLESYIGLVPIEYSSGDKQRLGHITKAGNKRLRSLLVEGAWSVMRHKSKPETESLRLWADRIAARRGKKIAAVALARRLAGILFAIWRDGSAFRFPVKPVVSPIAVVAN